MAEMTIRLRCDPATGKKDIIVSLRSDEELMPHEHEERHRALVEKLIGSGLLKAAELGKVVIERESAKAEAVELLAAEAQVEKRTLSEGQGSK